MQSGPGVQGGAQFRDGIAGGMSQIVGMESMRTQDNKPHGQILLCNSALLGQHVHQARHGQP
jgi:hypothetical protein